MTERPVLALASTSPRRARLLAQIGVSYLVLAPDADETANEDEPSVTTQVLARRKLQSVSSRLGSLRWALAFDTLVEHRGQALGKPTDQADAARMLRRLAGDTHRVHTGIALLRPDGTVDEALATTQVVFRPLDDQTIRWYIATEEWRSVAAGYRIQGRGAALIETIHGEYSNVVGLPVSTVCGMLRAGGYPFTAW